jgi:hypothetical protein
MYAFGQKKTDAVHRFYEHFINNSSKIYWGPKGKRLEAKGKRY